MASKTNKTGRNVVSEHFTKMFRGTLSMPAWVALSTSAQAIYPFVKLEWHGSQANNNGRIRFSCRQAAKATGISLNTAMRAFRDLQAKGFLVVTQLGALGVEGEARGPSYELTEIELPQSEKHGGRCLFRNWQDGNDFPVAVHSINNPKGRNGKKIPSPNFRRSDLKNSDVPPFPIPKTKTPHLQIGDVGAHRPKATIFTLKTSLITMPRAEIEAPDLHVTAGLGLCPLLAGQRHG